MKIGIIGCGNMGQAILRGITAKNYIKKKNILAADKDRKKIASLRASAKINAIGSNRQLIQKCGVIILAVKPQDLDEVLQDTGLTLRKKLIISICAGISTKKLEKSLGKIAVARVMPNMPALISEGISAISWGRYVTAKERKAALSIFSCIGEVVEVKEELMDAVTAISGSGPAYFFYLVENLICTAQRLGIPRQVARRLAVKTALGSALLMNQTEDSPQVLRGRVSSKGGATEAAFKLFEKGRLKRLLRQGFYAAAKRSRQLSR